MAADSFKGALLGPQLYDKIKATIARVDGTPVGGAVSRIPTDLSGDVAFSPKVFRVCTFTGSWAINTAKTVTFRGVTSTPNTVSATNLVYELPSQGELPCGIAKDGTAWYLIAVKHTTTEVITNVTLGPAGLVFTKTRIQVVSTATASQVSIGTTTCA
jgi:hypothetical protein